jgi:hypothetical protein
VAAQGRRASPGMDTPGESLRRAGWLGLR